MEEEARELLRQALYGGKAVPGNLAIAIRQLFEPLGGMDLEIPLRTPGRAPPDFSE